MSTARGRKPIRRPERAAVHPDFGELVPPAELVGAALVEWHRLVALLSTDGRITALDTGVLARYCQARADWAESVAAFDSLKASVVKTPKGGYVVHPIARMRYRIAGEMRECEKVLGLSPLAREKIAPPEKPSDAMLKIVEFAEQARARRRESNRRQT
jgi:P27 family predicted phage terminase small subunit